jgi:hypothetical protein
VDVFPVFVAPVLAALVDVEPVPDVAPVVALVALWVVGELVVLVLPVCAPPIVAPPEVAEFVIEPADVGPPAVCVVP